MTITKYGQCCLLIEHNGKRILTDPGRFTTSQNEVCDIDLILITHEHADHLHTESLQTIINNNPEVIIVTNSSVGTMLEEEGISFTLLEGSAHTELIGIALEAYDGEHAEIFEEMGLVQNTGYFIDNTLFYPGDAFTDPQKPVPILALPIAGPWCKLPDALNYALALAPEKCFPVHDWLLNEEGVTLTYMLAENGLKKHQLTFIPLHNSETKEF